MGLDTYKYELVMDNPCADSITSDELAEFCDSNNMHYVIFKSHQEYSHENNKRLIDLFSKFKKYAKLVTIEDLIDYNYYNEKSGLIIDELDVVYGYNLDDLHHVYSENEHFMSVYNEYKSNKDNQCAFNVLLYILKSKNEIVFCEEDIKTYSDTSEYLLFNEVGYERNNELPSLYDNFYGDCWYKKEGTQLNMIDARHFVYPSEMDELKASYKECASLQNWELNENEIVYINP